MNPNSAEILKDSIIKYLLENHNITWLDDQFEKQIYELIYEFILSYAEGSPERFASLD